MNFNEILRVHPLQNLWNFNEIPRGTPCKVQRISMKSWGVPLAKYMEFQWNPKGYLPLAECIEFQSNPKGYPLHNVRNFNEILRGTLREMWRISMKSLGVPFAKYTECQWNPKGYPLQNVKNFNEILRSTPDILRGMSFDSMWVQIPDSSVDCAGWDLGACISAALGAGEGFRGTGGLLGGHPAIV